MVVDREQPVFFVHQAQKSAVEHSLSGHLKNWRWRDLELKTFDQQPVAALYFDSMHAFYNARELLQASHISLFESDFRLQERYLMERFVRGGVEFYGLANQRAKYTEYTQVKIRPCEYRPDLTIVSLDIECSMKGDLFSIGLYGQARSTGAMAEKSDHDR